MKKNEQRRRQRNGQYKHEARCDLCGRAVCVTFGEYMSDVEVCGISDDPGWMLCNGDERCHPKGMTREQFFALPASERAKYYRDNGR